MAPQIHGYYIVNRPWKRYRGTSRDEWDELITAFYADELEEQIRRLMTQMKQQSYSRTYFPMFCEDRSSLASLLEFTWSRTQEVEVLAFHSAILEQRGFEAKEEPLARFLGVDVVPHGELSLLFQLEEVWEYHSGDRDSLGLTRFFERLINRHGLLDDEESWRDVVSYYDELEQKLEHIEPYYREGVECVRVFSLEASDVLALTPSGVC